MIPDVGEFRVQKERRNCVAVKLDEHDDEYTPKIVHCAGLYDIFSNDIYIRSP